MGGVALVERSGSVATSYPGRWGRWGVADGASSATASEAGVTQWPGPVHPCSHWPHPAPARRTDDPAGPVPWLCPGPAQAVGTDGEASAREGVTPVVRVAIASSAAEQARSRASIPVL